MSRISDIEDEIKNIESIEDYHKVQEKIAKLKDEHEENKSTNIGYVMEGIDIEDLEEKLENKYYQLERGENQKNEEIIVEEKQGEDDKEESSFLESEDSFYNQVRNKYGNRPDSSETTEIKMESIDSYINEVKEKMQNAGEDEITKIGEELYQKIESYKEQGISDDDLKKLEDFYTNNVMDDIFYYEELNELKLRIKEEESTQGKSTSTETKEQTNEGPEPEEPNEEEAEIENTADDEKLIDLLSERADLQFQIMKMKACAQLKRAGTFAKDNVNELQRYLKSQAKIYGVNEKKYAEVIEEYENALNEAATKYIEVQQKYLNGIGGHETWENNSIIDLKNAKDEKAKYIKSKEYKALKKKMDKEKKFEDSLTDDELEDIYESKANELKVAVDKGELDKIDEINEELKQIKALKTIKGFDKKIDDYRSQIKDARAGKESLQTKLEELEENYEIELSAIDESKETALTDITKQSAIGKTIGRISSLFKKINGNNKFQNEIVKPIKETTKHIVTETIPSIAKRAGDGIKSIPGGVKSIAEKARAKKQQAISKFKAKIKAKNEEDRTNLKNMQSEKETKTEEEKNDDDVIYF